MAFEEVAEAPAEIGAYWNPEKEGDYIRVELIEKIPPSGNNQYPTMKYKVLKDPVRGVDWE